MLLSAPSASWSRRDVCGWVRGANASGLKASESLNVDVFSDYRVANRDSLECSLDVLDASSNRKILVGGHSWSSEDLENAQTQRTLRKAHKPTIPK